MAVTYSRDYVKKLIDSGSHSLAIELLKVGIADIVREETHSKVLLGDRRQEVGRLAYSGFSSALRVDWRVRSGYTSIVEAMGYQPLSKRIRKRVTSIASRVFGVHY